MKFHHSLSTNLTKNALWELLSDFENIARCLPGVEDVQQIDFLTYKGIVGIRIGPMRFSFSGQIEIDETIPDGIMTFRAEGQDRKIGAGVRVVIETSVSELVLSKSELLVSADIQFSGRLAQFGQPLIKRKSDLMFEEFAANLKLLIDK